MKKLLTLTICFVFVGVAAGQDKPSSFSESLQKYTWNLGTEISHIRYEEPGLMVEEGTMYGLVASCTYRGWAGPSPEAQHKKKYMHRVEGKFSYGWVDYNGELSDGTPYKWDNIFDYMLEIRYLIGYDFLKTTTMHIPYIGIGYRYLCDDEGTSDPYGYERESNYIYCPIGIEYITVLNKDWSLGGTAEFDLFLIGIQRSHLSDISPLYEDIENRQMEGYGLRGSIKFQKKGEKVDWAIEPFIRYWDIAKSEVSKGAYEPKNNSTEYGIRLAAKF